MNRLPEPRDYHGSCHCRAVTFRIHTVIDKVVECNCSICRKKGVLHHRVKPHQFTLLSGEAALNIYRFDSGEATHYFCRHCGMHPFSHPRSAPHDYSINVRCLDDFDLQTASFETLHFDGQNWEESVAALNAALEKELR